MEVADTAVGVNTAVVPPTFATFTFAPALKPVPVSVRFWFDDDVDRVDGLSVVTTGPTAATVAAGQFITRL